jgi:tetratricopeptide (TPR) repeat protein
MSSTQPHRPYSEEDTQPTLGEKEAHAPISDQKEHGSSSRRSWWKRRWLFILSPLYVITIVAASIYLGYQSGLDERNALQRQAKTQVIEEQLDLGIQELLSGDFERAKDRFEYVLTLEPDHEAATELLGRALEGLNQPTPTPRPKATPTPTETPDLGSYEGIFQSAQAAFNRSDWASTLDLLLRLRGEDPTYRLDEVNRLMASALRNQGMDKLFQGMIELGVYDLNLAERFGPLDNQAASWRRSAVYYSYANSFFGLDWALAAEHFAQLCVADIWLSCSKYAEAALEYARLLADDKQYCEAMFYFGESLAQQGDPAVEPTATEVASICLTATAPTPTATATSTLGTETPTWTATFVVGSATPTPTATASPTVGPSPTPTATSADTPASTPTMTATSTNTPPPTNTPTATSSATQ